MAAGAIWIKEGPTTYETADTLNLGANGVGIVVEGRAASKIGVAASASTRVVGVAITDGIPVASQAALQSGTAGYGGFPVIDTGVPTERVTVVNEGQVRVTYVLAANFGDPLIVGTVAGQVSPAGATPDARTLVGFCAEPAGVSAGGVGLMKVTR